MSPTPVAVLAAVLFACALVHSFATGVFTRLAHRYPRHAGALHLLGEVEVVFGFWALLFVLGLIALQGRTAAVSYLESQNFTEPLFVFVVMVIAASRPILQLARALVMGLAFLLPARGALGFFVVALTVLPLLGSFITEAAAMTVAALMLRDRLYGAGLSQRLKYATLGVLFVNVSIGGTLTTFAAPPVLMVAGTWGWDNAFMVQTFGWRAALAVFANALLVALVFRRELQQVQLVVDPPGAQRAVPWGVVAVHLAFLGATVASGHHPVVFVGLLLFFLGFATAYERHQDRLILREGLLVAFFLAGLVVLGGQQRWWLQPLLAQMGESSVYYGATLLTAVTDNAALTYLGSLVEGLSPEFQQALVAGAVTGGGLTVIANAPNPAGFSILRERFSDGAVHPAGLLLAALPPTLVAVAAFRLL
jgi:Putative Na+/H+ antiporter